MTEIAHSAPGRQDALLPTTLVLLSCFCFGTIPYFARSLTDAGMASHAVAFYRYGISALVLFPLLLRLPRSKWRTIFWGMASGAFVGLGPEIGLAMSLIRRVRELGFGIPALIAWQVSEGNRALRRKPT